MTKTLQQVKNEVGEGDNFYNWDDLFASCAMYDYERLESAIDEVAIRYAQEQNKQLIDWKDSEMKVQSELNLQGIGSELGLKLGSSIAPQILPKIKKINYQKRELVEMLEECVSVLTWTLENARPDSDWTTFTNSITNAIVESEELITKHKQS